MRVKDAVGRYGEQVAVDHLVGRGFTVVARNWRCRQGELDIVARDGSQLVFVEVKTRSSLSHGSPAEAVGAAKSARIRQLAVRWLMAQRESGAAESWSSLRFDVVAVHRRPGLGPAVVHVEGAF